MKISADCIEEEELETNEQQLSETFSKMDLNSSNAEMNETKEGLNGSEVRVIYRYCSPNESHSIEKDGFISLTVIPIIDNNFHDGYYSNWDEVKNQVLNLNFKDRNKVPKTLSFVGKIGSGNCELTLITKEDYFTALKVAELCGQPLDVMIRTSVPVQEEVVENNIPNTYNSKNMAESEKVVESENQLSDSENEMNDDKNGFVVLENTPNLNNDKTVDSCAQIGSDNKNSILTDDQIEGLKRDITIDVTKRIISKLNECLLDLNVGDDSSVSSKSDIKPNSRAESLVNNDLNSSPINDNTQVIHYGIICDNCETQIKGIRYKCSICLDFDLCEKCETLSNIHNEDHSFLKIKQYIKPSFKMPNKGQDLFLAVDVDLPTGKIINIGDLKVVSKPKSVRSTQTNEQIREQLIPNSSANSKTSNIPKDEAIGSLSSDPMIHMKNRMSEKRTMKIAKKLEKLKLKGQVYSNLLQTCEERTSRHESKASTSVVNPQPISSNKTLFLSGLFVGDETIPEGTRMPPLTKFRKTWRVRNTGTKVWTGRTTLRYVWGHSELEPFGKVTEVQAPQLRPGEEGKVTIRFNAPKSSRIALFQSHWRLHHRGQPFGQRLICRVVIDPNATAITQPSNVPKASANVQTNSSPKDTHVMPSIRVPTLKSLSTGLTSESKAKTLPKPVGLNKRFQEVEGIEKSLNNSNKEKIHEALTAVKEIRFSLDDNELIPMKTNVKSHTATPANTPFDISPPKSPEPNSLSNSMTRIESNLNNGTNNDNNKNEEDLVEDKSNEAEENESMSVLSLSSCESSDEFVLVPLPRCFDLNVPFNGIDSISFNASKNENIFETEGINANFELIDEPLHQNQNIGQNGHHFNDQIDCLDENSPLLGDNDFPEFTNAEEVNNIAIDLSKSNKSQNIENHTSKQVESDVETTKASAPQPESQTQDKPKPISFSTNPFRDSSNETENVIHVLPESIVTGALSAAAHVYNNINRALFPRNEGHTEGRHYPWITSPPPAAIPLPDCYWDSSRGLQYQPREYFSTTSASTNSTLTTTSKNAGIVTTTSAPSSVMTNASSAAESQRNRLLDASTQLFEMGFWNKKLNQELLEKNNFDVNDTIEDLLSPQKGRQTRSAGSDEVVSRQPKNQNRNGFIEEFD